MQTFPTTMGRSTGEERSLSVCSRSICVRRCLCFRLACFPCFLPLILLTPSTRPETGVSDKHEPPYGNRLALRPLCLAGSCPLVSRPRLLDDHIAVTPPLVTSRSPLPLHDCRPLEATRTRTSNHRIPLGYFSYGFGRLASPSTRLAITSSSVEL